ncbi:reticulon 1 [Cricetulus griseus]
MQATADSTKMDCVWSNWKSQAIDLLYWRDIKQTGIVFGSFLLLLFSLTQFSVVSVVAYLALAALSATISFRIYKSVLQAVQKTDEGHPFKAYLELEITLSQEQIQKYTDCLQLYVNSTLKELRRLFLVQDLVDSLKAQIDQYLGLVRTHINTVVAKYHNEYIFNKLVILNSPHGLAHVQEQDGEEKEV